jgi:hypothetical protein
MRLRWMIPIVALVVAQLGCSLVTGGPSPASPTQMPATQAPAKPTAAPPTVVQAAPSATAAQPSATAVQPSATAQKPQPTSAPAKPTATNFPAVEGPQSLDLSNSTLFHSPLNDYSSSLNDELSSSGQDGNPLKIINRYEARYQSQPDAWSLVTAIFDDSTREQTTMVDGVQYSASADGECSQGKPGNPPQDPLSALAGQLTGKAQRVEAGVMVGDKIADKYALKPENLTPGGKVVLVQALSTLDTTSTSTTTLTLHGTGSLYLAREGGYILRVELADKAKATPKEFFFKPGSEISSKTVFELLPTQQGDAPLAPPANCSVKATQPPAADTTYPRLDDAQIILEESQQLIYQTSHSLDEAKNFYMQEMPSTGWTLESNSEIGPIVELIFSKDGQTVTITLMQTSDTVTVTIS